MIKNNFLERLKSELFEKIGSIEDNYFINDVSLMSYYVDLAFALGYDIGFEGGEGKAFRRVRIVQYNQHGEYVKTHTSIQKACEEAGVLQSTMSQAVASDTVMCKGYFWRKEGVEFDIDNVMSLRAGKKEQYGKKVIKKDVGGGVLCIYPSIVKAARMERVDRKSIYLAILEKRLLKGYYWEESD